MSAMPLQSNRPLSLFFRGLLTLVGAWFCIQVWLDAWQTRQDYLRLEQHSISCQATVTDKTIRHRRRGSLLLGDRRHRLFYEYRDPEGHRAYRDSIAVGQSTYDSLEVGDAFAVAVDPERPEVNRPSFAEPPSLVLFGMGAAVLLTLGVGCWQWWLCLAGLQRRARPGEND